MRMLFSCITARMWQIFFFTGFRQKESLTEAHNEQSENMMILQLHNLQLEITHSDTTSRKKKAVSESNVSAWFLHIDLHLAGRAGQRHPPLQLPQDLLLQQVQPSSTQSSSGRTSFQVVPLPVHQVVVDADQGFIMGLWEERHIRDMSETTGLIQTGRPSYLDLSTLHQVWVNHQTTWCGACRTPSWWQMLKDHHWQCWIKYSVPVRSGFCDWVPSVRNTACGQSHFRKEKTATADFKDVLRWKVTTAFLKYSGVKSTIFVFEM